MMIRSRIPNTVFVPQVSYQLEITCSKSALMTVGQHLFTLLILEILKERTMSLHVKGKKPKKTGLL